MDSSADKMELLGEVYEEVGLPDLWVVPLVVIGPYAIIGYADEPTTTAEILTAVEECRKQGCRDVLRNLINRRKGQKEVSIGMESDLLTCRSDPLWRVGRFGAAIPTVQPTP